MSFRAYKCILVLYTVPTHTVYVPITRTTVVVDTIEENIFGEFYVLKFQTRILCMYQKYTFSLILVVILLVV